MLLIFSECADAADQQAAGAIGAQAQVGFVQTPSGGVAAEHRVDALRQPGIDFSGIGMRVVIQENQIQIGGIAQFASAQLAIGNDGEAMLGLVFFACFAPAQLQHMI